MNELTHGDKVVVPGLGVGEVQAREMMDVGGQQLEVYCIDLGEELGRLWVPVDRVGESDLRQPMPASRVEVILDLIQKQQAPSGKTPWNRRRRRYTEMMMSNRPRELAQLIGELVAVRARKRQKKQTLSFDERRILERAKLMIAGEIAAATGATPDAAAATVQEAVQAAA